MRAAVSARLCAVPRLQPMALAAPAARGAVRQPEVSLARATRRMFSSTGKPQPAEGGASASATAAESIAKPRAVGATAMNKRRKHFWRVAIGGGTLLFGGILAYQNDFSIDQLVKNAKQLVANWLERTPGDPNIEDLQRALGPPPPDGYLSVLLSVEDVIVRREWDRRYGWIYEPREGVKELLRSLVDPSMGVFVTIWSENSVVVGNEVLEKLTAEVGGPAAHTQPLGLEHMFIRDGNKRKEKRLEYFNRDPRTVLLVDWNPLSEQLNPHNTVLVRTMSEVSEEREAAQKAGKPLSPDTTCAGIKSLIQRIREDQQLTGSVNVPRTLARLREEAHRAGFSTDTHGLYSYLTYAAAQEQEVERQRREMGLGGALRRTVQKSPVLRNKPTTTEAAMMKGYRDPGAELGEDSLLTRKVREAQARLFRQPGS